MSSHNPIRDREHASVRDLIVRICGDVRNDRARRPLAAARRYHVVRPDQPPGSPVITLELASQGA
jgi:hypothetical protein